jgi:hypothetical protein
LRSVSAPFEEELQIAILKWLNVRYVFGNVGSVPYFETTALLAFGVAWLTKGETFLQDENT